MTYLSEGEADLHPNRSVASDAFNLKSFLGFVSSVMPLVIGGRKSVNNEANFFSNSLIR